MVDSCLPRNLVLAIPVPYYPLLQDPFFPFFPFFPLFSYFFFFNLSRLHPLVVSFRLTGSSEDPVAD